MKIIDASYEILDRRGMSLEEKIEHAGRLAYKSEDKITKDSAIPFCKKIIGKNKYPESGHFPVLEFANIHLSIFGGVKLFQTLTLNLNTTKYVTIHRGRDHVHISGTVRAFKECLNFATTESCNIAAYLYKVSPTLFPEFSDLNDRHISDVISMYNRKGLENHFVLYGDNELSLKRHFMVGVKFICNRAVSHELVRHRATSLIQESQRYCRYGSDVVFINPKAFFEKDTPEYSAWWAACKDAESQYMYLLNERECSPQAARTVLPNSCKTEIIVYATIKEWEHIFALRTSPAAEPSMRELMIPLKKEFFDNCELWE